MSHPKHAAPDHAIHELIAARWSPYGWIEKPVPHADVTAVFEAARWAPSSYNEQPWSWIVAAKDQDPDGFQKLLGCLVEGNQAWAQTVPVLAIGVISTRFSRNDKPNKAASHDLGLAAGNLCLEATARGICVHQMIGILPDAAREAFSIPEGHEAFTALALGYAADPATLPEETAKRDTAPRTRKPLSELLHSPAGWGTPSPLAG